jgi:transposase-like protein
MPSREALFAALGSPPAAVVLLTALRWPTGVTCPHCGSSQVGGHGRYTRGRDLPRYRCKAKACGHTFLPSTGTPLSRSCVPLPGWVVIAWLIVLGLSSWCAAREIYQPYDRVYALMWRLIEAAIGQESDRKLSGTVEVDEFYVSSDHKGEPESSPNPRKPEAETTPGRERGLRPGPGRGYANKDRSVVFVLVARGGLRIVEAGASVDQATIRPLFERYVPLSSRVCADSARCYTLLSAIGYEVEQVNHGEGEYARGDVHENTAECEIGLLQQFLLSHRGISMVNLPSYLKLHQFRRNERERPYRDQACLLLAVLLGVGTGPRCLLPAGKAHDRDECEVWRPPGQQIEEAVTALAA